MKQEHLLKGALFCSIAGIGWGAQFPIAGIVLQTLDPFYFTFIRYCTAAVVLLVILAMVEGRKSLKFEGKAKILWFFGTMAFCGYNFFVFLGQKLAGVEGAVLASIMMAMMPMVSVIVIWIYKKSKPNNMTIAFIIAAFIGVSMVITKGDVSVFLTAGGNLFSAFLILIGVFCWVIYTIGGTTMEGWSPLRYTALSCLLGNISSFVIIVIVTSLGYLSVPRFGEVVSLGLEMSYLILIAGVLAPFSWNAGNKALSPINGILFINLVPITTFVVTIIQGYRMTWIELLGAFITMGALMANNLYQRYQNNKPVKAVAKAAR